MCRLEENEGRDEFFPVSNNVGPKKVRQKNTLKFLVAETTSRDRPYTRTSGSLTFVQNLRNGESCTQWERIWLWGNPGGRCMEGKSVLFM